MKLSKFAVAVSTAFIAQASSAALISVQIDSFDGPGLALGGTFQVTSITPNDPNAVAYTVNALGSPSRLAVSAQDGYNFQAKLTYDATVNLGLASLATYAGTNGAVVYSIVSNDLGGGSITPGAGVTVAGPSGPFSPPYVLGSTFALSFNSNGTSSWDVSIDNIGVQFECSSVARPVSYTSIAAFTTAMGKNSCATVPVPGSLALLGLGGIAAGLVSRRRAAK